TVLAKADERFWPERGTGVPSVVAPGPGVAKPKGRQQMEDRRFWATIRHGDPDQDVVRRRLGVLHEDVKVTSFLEDPGVEQLELGVPLAAPAVLVEQPLIRELRLRILVERFEVRVRRRGIEIEVALLAILSVVALRAGQPEQSFLENGIAAVPQRQGKTQAALPIANPQQPVLAPAIGTAASMIVWKILPGRPVPRIILAHGAPLPFGQVRPPTLPVLLALGVLF